MPTRTLCLLVALSLFLGCQSASTQGPTGPEKTADDARERLCNAKLYGFGNKDGPANQPDRDTDAAMKVLLAQPDAGDQFARVFENANLYGKLYALYGLHQLNDPRFNTLAKSLDHNQKAHARSGCVYDEKTVGQHLADMKSGDTAHWVAVPAKRDAAQSPPPLGNHELIRSAFYRNIPTHELYGTKIPAGTKVVIDVVCKAPRDMPFCTFIVPDSIEQGQDELPKRFGFGAHFVGHADLNTMQQGKAYRVRGVVGRDGDICYAAYEIQVESFEPIN